MKKMTPQEAWENAGEILKKYFESQNPKGYELLMKIHNDKKDEMLKCPAAVKHHHNYHGGYIVHINEVMMAMDQMLENGFDAGLVDHGRAILAAYIHDLDKLERYEELPFESPSENQLAAAEKHGIPVADNETKKSLSTKIGNKFDGTNHPIEYFRYKQNGGYSYDETSKVQQMLVQYGLPLHDEILHAVTMHHGGWALHAADRRINMSPMATLLNAADMISSKIMYQL